MVFAVFWLELAGGMAQPQPAATRIVAPVWLAPGRGPVVARPAASVR